MHTLTQSSGSLQEYRPHNKTESMYRLGRRYYTGKGVAADHHEALKCFIKGAEHGDQRCFFQLGYMYYKGQGVKKDITKAIEWYTKSANVGYQPAIDNLSMIMATQRNATHLISQSMKVSATIFGTIFLVAVSCYISLLASGCAAPKPISQVVVAPPGSSQNIDSAKVATTQVSQRLTTTTTMMTKRNQDLQDSTTAIQTAANNGKAATPSTAAALLNPWWDNILREIESLVSIKSDNDKAIEQIKAQRDQVDQLTTQLDAAKTAAAAKDDFLTKTINTNQQAYEKTLGDKDIIIKKLSDDNAKALRDKLVWVIIASIVLFGASIALAIAVNPVIGKACAIASGTILVTATIWTELASTFFLAKYFVGAIGIIVIGVLIWQIIVHRDAITGLLQQREMSNQLLTPEAKSFLWGNGAFEGVATKHDKSPKIFAAHLAKRIRKATDTQLVPTSITMPLAV